MAKVRQYRLLQGKYEEGKGKEKKHYAARDHKGELRNGLPDIVHTDKRLDRLFGTDKFRLISAEEARIAEAEKEVDSELLEELKEFSIAELKAYAQNEEIEITGCTKKLEILEAIQESLIGA